MIICIHTILLSLVATFLRIQAADEVLVVLQLS